MFKSCVLLLYNLHIILGCRFTNCSPWVCLNSSVLIPSTGKKAARKLSDVEEEEENEIPHLEEGEKENEDLCNEGGTPVSKPKKKRKRKNEQDASTEEANDKKNKTDEKSSEQGTGAFCYFRKIFFFHKVIPLSPRVCGTC